MGADSVYGIVHVEHRIPWRGAELTFTSYELQLVLRLADGGHVPLADLPIAWAFVERFKKDGLDFKEVAAAISQTVSPSSPHLGFLDDSAINDSPELLAIAEAIYVQHNDRWREDDADLWTTTVLFPSFTGLPSTIWLPTMLKADQEAVVLVATSPSERSDAANAAILCVQPEPHLIAGPLNPAYEAAAVQWIRANSEVLVAHWSGVIDSAEMIRRLRLLGPDHHS
ncbi:hypothetical protein [Acidiphilium sp. JA12-A1]|uniref:hypothetical protein n=1 Tax=Acidiphilium sp. JA12-A1 TaxID=1464546 RepID=UPI000460E75C|nr:hypothetical protein [Acidiphilium sp. JA12-A1]KDM65140.1 hypothetical protein ACIDI_186c00040 [Acidiphilium sp. JA12-A1]